jgi:hypothetical protein
VRLSEGRGANGACARESNGGDSRIFLSYAQDDEAAIIVSSLGITAILDPTRPKSLFSAAFTAQ